MQVFIVDLDLLDELGTQVVSTGKSQTLLEKAVKAEDKVSLGHAADELTEFFLFLRERYWKHLLFIF